LDWRDAQGDELRDERAVSARVVPPDADEALQKVVDPEERPV